jgi:DNA-binding SARP family transcriptional activator
VDEFRLLGPLEAVVHGRPLHLAAEKPRALLALLLLHANRVVSTERLVDELWGDEPPARATKTLQVYVSQLRKGLGAERLVTRPPGYELRVAPGELDLERFETMAASAREQLAAGDPEGAATRLREALALWRGPALREFRAEPFAERAAARLDELRFAAREDLVAAELDAGATAAAVPELEQLVAHEPLRERPRELLMLALYRSGRQADALDLFRRTRTLFVDELGIEPGQRLRELEAAMLRQDDALTPSASEPQPVRVAKPMHAPRRWRVGLAALAVALAAAAGLAAVLARDGDGTASPARDDTERRAFVVNIENFLGQSRDGRADVRRAVQGALDCSLPRRTALARLDRVQANRQSLLQQIAAVRVPPGGGPLRAADLLQQALQASIAADFLYREWLRMRGACRGVGPPPETRRADARATALKRDFVAVFNPLARRAHLRTWRGNEF